jgi:hypothetical protein
MRYAWMLIALTGCISDLAVGMSSGLISEPDADVPDVDAGTVDDAALPPLDVLVIYSDDASLPVHDAAADASYDAETYPKTCAISECIQFLIVEGCEGGGAQVCARPRPELACEWLCL